MTKPSIDLGLAILGTQLGKPRTYEEIASYCGCSWQNIRRIEQVALRKLRFHLEKEKAKIL